jgi:hypothetical protein
LEAQILWRPNGSISIVANQYAVGRDTLGVPNRTRFHTDDSIQVKYYDHPERFFTQEILHKVRAALIPVAQELALIDAQKQNVPKPFVKESSAEQTEAKKQNFQARVCEVCGSGVRPA